MPLALIETGHCNVDLKPSPIEPSWILEGNPEAHSHVLSTSACGAATTLIWSCIPPRHDGTLPHSMILWASLPATTFRSCAKHTT
jgi:uncharacterized cupin superfamily protein